MTPDHPLLLAALRLALTWHPGAEERLPARGHEISDADLLRVLQKEMGGAGLSYKEVPGFPDWRAGWSGGYPDPEPTLYLFDARRERHEVEASQVLALAREILGVERPAEDGEDAAPIVAIQEKLW